MKLEKQSISRGVPRRKGRSSFSFLICFRPSPVYDSDGPPQTATRDRWPRWFCFAVRTKKKKKENRKKAVQAHAPAKPLPAADDSRLEINASIAKDGDVDDNSNNNSSSSGGIGSSRSNKRPAEDGRGSDHDHVDFNSQKTDHSLHDWKPRRIIIGSRIDKLDPSIATAGIMAIALALVVFVGRSAAIVCLSSFLCIFQLVIRISSSRDKKRGIIDMDPAELNARRE